MSYAGTSTAVDSLIGTTLAGRYRIEARVGSGAMGAVYRAEQTGLGRRVALKIVNRGRQVDYDTIQRFRREATALSALHHPNTVRVFDFGTTPAGLFYLAMELLEGEPLTACMYREKPLDLPLALSVTQQVLRSIGEAHARGIVHRDLKPDNIYLARVQSEPLPIVKVLDFGIAKAVAGAGTINQFETMDGTVFGTPRYMSPEQAGGRALDARSDLYSVGIMLYELVCGNPPFTDGDAVVVMARHIRDKPIQLSRAMPPGRSISANLDAVVSRALAKSPSERFQTADEFERAVERCRAEITGQRPVSFARLGRGKGRGLWAAVAGVALVAGAGGAYYARRMVDDAKKADEAGSPTAAVGVGVGTAEALPRLAEPMPAMPDDLQIPEAHVAAPAGSDKTETDQMDPVAEDAPRVVSLQSVPSAATVLQDGAELGLTPLDVSLNKGSTLTLLLKKKGFAEHKVEVRPDDGTRMVTLRRLIDHVRLDRPTDHPLDATSEKSKEGSLGAAQAQPREPALKITPAPLAPVPSPSAAAPLSPSVSGSASGSEKRSPYERF